MKKLLAAICSLAVLACGALAFAGCGGDGKQDLEYVKDKGTLVVGCTEFQPITYLEGGEWKGFDVEFARAVGEKLGVEVEFQIIKWSNKVFELNSKNIDCIWNGMTITEELQEQTEVSSPYMRNQQVAVIRVEDKDKYTDQSSIKDQKIVAENGSAGAGFGEELSDQFVAIDTQVQVFTELENKSADIGILDSVLAKYYLATPAYEGKYVLVDMGFPTEEYGIAFRKDSNLCEAVNEALAEMFADGSMQEIASAYGLESELIEIK